MADQPKGDDSNLIGRMRARMKGRAEASEQANSETVHSSKVSLNKVGSSQATPSGPHSSEPLPKINPAINFSVTRYVFSIGVFVAVVLLGLLNTTRLGVELLPNFEVPILAVSTGYSGATPDQVDREISRKIEDAVSTISGVSDIRSTSTSGQSAVIITFQDGTNIDSAANSVSQSVAAIRGTLPNDADAPIVQKFDPNAQPILTLALQGGTARAADVATYANDTLVPRLQRVAGVADITVSGGPTRQIQVLIDPSKLQSYNLTPARLTAAIGASALDLPAGSLTQNGNSIGFSTRNTPTSLQGVGRIIVDPQTGLTVSDVATVRDTSAAASSYARFNGQPAVLLGVRKASGTNSVSVADSVRASMESVKLPPGYRLSLSEDSTRTTRATVNDTFKEFLIGIAAVGVVVLLFLGRLNTVFAVVLAIPISISAAPLLYSLFGFTFNLISLLAIIVAIGIVVDDSIVVAENVQRYRDLGYDQLKSVLYGGSEVFSAVTAASFSLLAVLVPLSFMPGILGQFFRQFAIGLIAAIALSWLESLLFLTVRMAYTRDPDPIGWPQFGRLLGRLPEIIKWGFARKTLLSAWGILGLVVYGVVLAVVSRRAGTGPAIFAALLLYPLIIGLVRYVLMALLGLLEAVTSTLHGIVNGAVIRLARAYARSVAWALPRNLLIILLAVAFLFTIAIPIGKVGFAFVPKSDGGILTASLTLPVGTSLDQTNLATRKMEEYLLAQKDVKLVSTSVGSGSSQGTGANGSAITVTLIDKKLRPGIDSLVANYQVGLKKALSGVTLETLSVAAQQNGPGGSSDISLALSAPNQTVLEAKNRDLIRLLGRDSNLSSVTSSLSATRQERNFVPNQAQLVGSGLTTSDLAQALRSYNDGSKAGSLRDGDNSVDIVVKLDPSLLQTEQSLLSQTVYSSVLGANVPLSSLGSFRLQQAPATLNRFNKAYTATININLKKGGPNAFSYQQTIINNATKAGILSGGVGLGNASSFGSAGLTGNLVVYGPAVLVLAVLMTYLVLGSQFNSFRYPLYLLLPVPLAIVGAVWTLFFFKTSLDVITILGMVILLGLATKNSILYLEFVVERMRHLPIKEALIEAAELRFRPIIMTTVTVLVISIPLIFGGGEGAEFRRGLGIVIMGGVITGTLLTFYVVPSVFYRFEKNRQKPREVEVEALPGRIAPATD
ncbi:efflux RND transporter permease subunit [Deinococcus rubellus]|uniref:Efflux RND transporter permease subunit n=1 Tax=Deinococcus rubellus TaxID=1889240 RepID=A0ABY5YKJ4_9DEIO|nr:efflux RND transporter permease subunit [Deinococcus rubellus]UWX65338.1 efflux RND transporter permease subunit [Deinococcus rubellus]